MTFVNAAGKIFVGGKRPASGASIRISLRMQTGFRDPTRRWGVS